MEAAVGFTTVGMVLGEGDTIAHAELKLGSSVFMMATAKPEAGRCSPMDASCPGGKAPCATHGMYIVVTDSEAAYKRAKDAGANITKEPYTTHYGSRDFELTDPEGPKWYLGTYPPSLEKH